MAFSDGGSGSVPSHGIPLLNHVSSNNINTPLQANNYASQKDFTPDNLRKERLRRSDGGQTATNAITNLPLSL